MRRLILVCVVAVGVLAVLFFTAKHYRAVAEPDVSLSQLIDPHLPMEFVCVPLKPYKDDPYVWVAVEDKDGNSVVCRKIVYPGRDGYDDVLRIIGESESHLWRPGNGVFLMPHEICAVDEAFSQLRQVRRDGTMTVLLQRRSDQFLAALPNGRLIPLQSANGTCLHHELRSFFRIPGPSIRLTPLTRPATSPAT